MDAYFCDGPHAVIFEGTLEALLGVEYRRDPGS